MSFSSPPKVVGSGSLGVMILAEYRGAAVVVKIIVPLRKMDSRRNEGGGADFISISDTSLPDSAAIQAQSSNLV